jgi:hypothetical protein
MSEIPLNEPAEDKGSAPRPLSPLRKRWLAVALGIGGLALAYGVGRLQGALALKAVEEEGKKDRQAAQARFEACETDGQLLSARRDLSLVALSLDRRNFGVAETQRRSALSRLEQSSLSGVPRVPELAAAVRGLDLAVDPDPGAQREQVISVTEALDAVLATRRN